jgi:ribonucleoside-triphosphate reductase
MLIGCHHGESEIAQNIGLEIVGTINDKCQQYKDSYKLNYSCLATPAEGLSGRFTTIDRKEFGKIPGVTDREYYTNSCHIPVYYPISANKKIELEAPYHAISTGGHITYVEMDTEAKKNPLAFIKIIHCMYKNNVGYGSVNHPVDRCVICGHEGEIKDACPECGETEHIDRIRRITGYLVGTIDRWNSYKKAEERDRVKHKI